ncbi:MAG: glycosyltransferase 87 family protein, partial [Firmicutes bacterium]|nr:glycosyltransferase 87 family protein [Bacillota bacterium]
MIGFEGDIELYYKYAAEILRGLVPYRDFGIEYPPGAIPFFLLPKLLAGDILSYRSLFVAEVMVFDFIGLILILYYGRKHGFSPRHLYQTGLLYVVLPAIIGLVGYQRFDLIPAVLVLAAVVLLDRGCRVSAWALLGLSFAVKLYPVILIPVFLISGLRKKTLKKDVLYGLPAFVITAAAVWLPYLKASGPKFWFFLSYHGSRGIQLESLYATMLLAARWFGYPVSTEFSYGSWNVVSAISPVLARTSFFFMAALMAVVLVHSFAARHGGLTYDDLPRQALLMVMGFVIGSKVFSPQYILWLIPLLVISLREDSP